MRNINWSALSTIAELIGAAGVVVSLVYVATEIQQNTRQVEEANRIQRLAQLDAAFENFSRIRLLSAESAEVTRIWLDGIEDPGGLDSIERARFESLLGEMLNASQVLYARVEEGLLTQRSGRISCFTWSRCYSDQAWRSIGALRSAVTARSSSPPSSVPWPVPERWCRRPETPIAEGVGYGAVCPILCLPYDSREAARGGTDTNLPRTRAARLEMFFESPADVLIGAGP